MWSKVEGGRKVSWGRVAPTLTFSIVQHISSKVASDFYLYLFYISADLRIIFLCFDNIHICQRVELAEMLWHMCH